MTLKRANQLVGAVERTLASVTAAGPTGWVALIAIAAIVLSGFAIHAVVVIATTLK